MWVPRTPMRPDFCGCVGCPYCYAWADDDGVVDGVIKMTRDLLGSQKPTPAQKRQLTTGAKLVHANNLARKEADQLREQEARDASDLKWTEREANALLKQERRKAKAPKPKKVDPRPVMDNLGQKELDKRTRVPEPVPTPVLDPLYAGSATTASSAASAPSSITSSRINEMYRQMMREQEKILYESLTMPSVIKWDYGT